MSKYESRQSLRLHPEDQAIMNEWAEVISPTVRLDFSVLFREILKMTRHCIADERANLVAQLSKAMHAPVVNRDDGPPRPMKGT